MLKLKESSRSRRTLIFLALFAVAGGALTVFFAYLGLIFMPLLAAPLAVIFLIESGKRPIFTVAVPVIVIALDIVLNGYYSFGATIAVIVAIILSLSIGKGVLPKGEAVMAAVIVASLISGFSILMLGCYLVGEIDFSLALEYYRDLIADGVIQWREAAEQYILSASDPELAEVLTPENIDGMYYSYINGIYSLVVILAFVSVGLTCKLFGRLLSGRLADARPVQAWRFTLTPVYAYFYLAIYTIQMFLTEADAFSIALTNILNVFMIVFAYLGVLFVDAFFRMRSGGRGVNKLLLVIVVLLLSVLAINILSFVGVFATVMLDRAKKEGFGDDGNFDA